MRARHLLLLAAGCGFHSAAGAPDAALPIPDGGITEMRSFGAPELAAGQLQDMTVDVPRSALTPNAYTYGGLIAHGLQGARLWSRGDTSWSKLAGVTPSGAGLWSGEHLVNGGNLNYLGITNDGLMTIWFEGEVWLDAGSSETFTINGDDFTFVEIAQPGSTKYTLLTDQNTTVTVPASVSGWYPIHVGNGNMTGGNDLVFTHSDSGTAAGPVPWTRDRLRARTSELTGMMRTVFGHQILGGGQSVTGSPPPISHFDQSALLAQTGFPLAPQGADGDNNDWSAHYLGQVHIDQMGMYTLTISSDDGNRGRLGPGRGEMVWTRDVGVGPNDAVTPIPAMLAPGWNDLTVDYNQVGGARDLRVQIHGPDFPTALEVPRDRLRPVEPADDRLALGVDDADHAVADNGGMNNDGTATMSVAGFSGATLGTENIGAIDVTYQINSPHWAQLRVDLETPGGTRVPIRDHAGPPNNQEGRAVAAFTILPTSGGNLPMLLTGAARGDWKLHVFDDLGGGGGSALESARITVHTTGGPDKVARAASWTSAVIDATTPVIAVNGIAWNERIPDSGGGVIVQLGTCAQPDCSDVHWSGAVARGAAFGVTPARYLQLRVDMASDGSREPELSGLSIAYRRNP